MRSLEDAEGPDKRLDSFMSKLVDAGLVKKTQSDMKMVEFDVKTI